MGLELTPELVERYQALLSAGRPGDLFKDPAIAQMYEPQAAIVFGKGLAEYDEEIDRLLVITTYEPSDTVVDLGCGTGLSTQRILAKNPRKVIGMDASEAMLTEARKKFESDAKVELKVGNAEELSELVKGESIDKVFSASVFKYFSDPDAVLRQVHRTINPLGEYVFNIPLQDPEHASLYKSFSAVVEDVFKEMFGLEITLPDQNTGQEPKYTREDLETMAQKNGFNIKVYQEVPLVYNKGNLKALHDTLLEGLEYGITQVSDGGRAKEITARVRKKLEERFSEDKDYVFGKEAYVCLVRK